HGYRNPKSRSPPSLTGPASRSAHLEMWPGEPSGPPGHPDLNRHLLHTSQDLVSWPGRRDTPDTLDRPPARGPARCRGWVPPPEGVGPVAEWAIRRWPKASAPTLRG